MNHSDYPVMATDSSSRKADRSGKRIRTRIPGGEEMYLAALFGLDKVTDANLKRARQLLKQRGSLANILATPAVELAADRLVGPSRATNIALAQRTVADASLAPITYGVSLDHFSKISRYLSQRITANTKEQMRLILLAEGQFVISDEVLNGKYSPASPLDASTIVRPALISHAHSVIVALYRSGDNCEARLQDKIDAGMLLDTLGLFNIALLDFIILGRRSLHSFRQNEFHGSLHT